MYKVFHVSENCHNDQIKSHLLICLLNEYYLKTEEDKNKSEYLETMYQIKKSGGRALTPSLHFTHTQFFVGHAHFQKVQSAAAGPLTTALHTTEREGDNSIVYDFYFLAARWTVYIWGI